MKAAYSTTAVSTTSTGGDYIVVIGGNTGGDRWTVTFFLYAVEKRANNYTRGGEGLGTVVQRRCSRGMFGYAIIRPQVSACVPLTFAPRICLRSLFRT